MRRSNGHIKHFRMIIACIVEILFCTPCTGQVRLLLFRSLCAVKRTGLHSFGNALRIERTADDVVTYARQVTDSAAAYQNYAVLLQVVTDTGYIARCLKTVDEFYSCDLTDSGVRLLRRSRRNLGADASLLGRALIRSAFLQ